LALFFAGVAPAHRGGAGRGIGNRYIIAGFFDIFWLFLQELLQLIVEEPAEASATATATMRTLPIVMTAMTFRHCLGITDFYLGRGTFGRRRRYVRTWEDTRPSEAIEGAFTMMTAKKPI
jgi:hypothetical protein